MKRTFRTLAACLSMTVATAHAVPRQTASPERYEIVERTISSEDYHRLLSDVADMRHISERTPGRLVFRRIVSAVPNAAIGGTTFTPTIWHVLGRGRMRLKAFGLASFPGGKRYVEFRDLRVPYPWDVNVSVGLRRDGAWESTVYPGPPGRNQTYLMLSVRSLP